MTLGCPPPQEPQDPSSSSACSVSSVAISLPDDEAEESSRAQPGNNSRMHWKMPHSGIRRLVSSDGIVEKENNMHGGCTSPIRCVSDFDRITSVSKCSSDEGDTEEENVSGRHTPTKIPSLPNPLHHAGLLMRHLDSTRREGELQPIRLILSRLMAHPTLNRKGIFNAPVDPVALNLPDYFKVITRPMDLGTVKAKLHAVSYKSRGEVVADIRLVFQNAMKYNPPQNVVHVAARDMLAFFEEQLQAFSPEEAEGGSSQVFKDHTPVDPSSLTETRSASRTVSSDKPEASASPTTVASMQTLATRNSQPTDRLESPVSIPTRKRRKRGSRVNPSHSCASCEGRTCSICLRGCLHLEPNLLLCNGPNCSGTRIRKSSTYYISPEGTTAYCQRCHAGLPAVLPSTGSDETCRYKRDLLKRKNDEEMVERWLTCSRCNTGVHQICAMHNEFIHSSEDFVCPQCTVGDDMDGVEKLADSVPTTLDDGRQFTFVTGLEKPIALDSTASPEFLSGIWSADLLPETAESKFIQRKVRDCMSSCEESPNADRTILVRAISDCDRYFKVPEVVRKHFRMQTTEKEGVSIAPPIKVNYRSKAFALFQKIDGLDVCIFCMYVHEYDGDDEYERPTERCDVGVDRRVYIAYLDSVEHFRPRKLRTLVFQEILVAYLALARKRGYEAAHIWACPPSRGNSFVFWNHPESQRTPSQERLVAWYHGALSRAAECGVVTDVKSMYESTFQTAMEKLEDATPPEDLFRSFQQMICPPLLDGDFWIEETVRVHAVNLARCLRSGQGTAEGAPGLHANDDSSPGRFPATEIANLMRDRILGHPSAEHFRRPVNAAAMKLKDYHKIISKPMDLGTAYAKCVLGEYGSVSEFVDDVHLVFENAKRFNPEGHFVHAKAIEVSELFYTELNQLASSWSQDENSTWKTFANMSLSLDNTLERYHETTNGKFGCTEETKASSKGGVTDKDDSCDTLKSEELPGLIGGGPEAVEQRMVGTDTWLTDKRNPAPTKNAIQSKKSSSRRRKSTAVTGEEPAAKRRRQCWLGEEVGNAVRRMRTTFFACSLKSQSDVSDRFQAYVRDFDQGCKTTAVESHIAHMRHALLEFSQFRNLEFDTLRRAKYSTAMLLYHLHNDNAPGTVPICSDCQSDIVGVRWHKVHRVVEHRKSSKQPKKSPGTRAAFEPAELCSSCHSLQANRDQFIPLQVSMKPLN